MNHDVVDLILGCLAGYVFVQVLPGLWQVFREYLWRNQQPLLVVTRCDISDAKPPTVQIEGRVTTLKGKFFPRLARSANATVHASADGFVVTSAADSLPNARIEAEELCALEHDPATVLPVCISCVTLASIFVYFFSAGWLSVAMLASLLVCHGRWRPRLRTPSLVPSPRRRSLHGQPASACGGPLTWHRAPSSPNLSQ